MGKLMAQTFALRRSIDVTICLQLGLRRFHPEFLP